MRAPRDRARGERSRAAAEPALRAGRRRVMERCEVIGIGQSKYSKRSDDLSMDGLVRVAALRALEDAELTFQDIDAIVIGKAPDALEGVIMPELSLADALGAVGKPIHRVHTAGSVGASTAISACTLVESGMYELSLIHISEPTRLLSI